MRLIRRIDVLLEEYWGDAGAGVLPIAEETGRILVAYRSSRVLEPHTYGVFGGAVEPRESPKAAAKRELAEETGYRGRVKLVKAYRFEDGEFTYHNFLGLVPEEFEPRLDWETESADWIEFDELLSLRPKHFGLEALVKNSKRLIRKHAR